MADPKQPAAPDPDAQAIAATNSALKAEWGKKGYEENFGRAKAVFDTLPDERKDALEELRFRDDGRMLNAPEVVRWLASPDRHPSEVADLKPDRLDMEFQVEERLKQIEQAQKYLLRDSEDWRTLDREMKLLHGIRQRAANT